jgi:hypothetical protein
MVKWWWVVTLTTKEKVGIGIPTFKKNWIVVTVTKLTTGQVSGGDHHHFQKNWRLVGLGIFGFLIVGPAFKNPTPQVQFRPHIELGELLVTLPFGLCLCGNNFALGIGWAWGFWIFECRARI